MRSKKVIVTLLAVVVLALGSSLSAFAAVPGTEATSNAVVGFEAFDAWGDRTIVRPGPVKDPRANNFFTAPGPFRLAWVPSFNFGLHGLGGTVQTTFNVLCENQLAAGGVNPVGPVTALTTIGAPTPTGATLGPDFNTPGNHFVNVWDYRQMAGTPGGPTGWNVTVRMTQQFTEWDPVAGTHPANAHVLTGAYIRLNSATLPGGLPRVSGFYPHSLPNLVAPPTVREAPFAAGTIARITAPSGNRDIEFGAAANPVGIARAAAAAGADPAAGQGSTAINLGQGDNVQLRLPAGTAATVRPVVYRAVLTWTLSSAETFPTGTIATP